MLYIIFSFIFILAIALVTIFVGRKVQGNMGTNIGRKNAKEWGMDEGQEKDWY